jgi:hypothetical protein
MPAFSAAVFRVRCVATTAFSLLFLLVLSCVPAASQSSSERVAQLTERLEKARDLDRKNALDQSTGPVLAGDYLIRADKAQAAIDKIEGGSYISGSEIADALFVPPEQLTTDERKALIERLEQAKDLDDRGLHETTACGNAGTLQDFIVQGDKAEQAIGQLKQGQPIDWSEIGAALEVPSNP